MKLVARVVVLAALCGAYAYASKTPKLLTTPSIVCCGDCQGSTGPCCCGSSCSAKDGGKCSAE